MTAAVQRLTAHLVAELEAICARRALEIALETVTNKQKPVRKRRARKGR